MTSSWKKLAHNKVKKFFDELNKSHEIWIPYLEANTWSFKEYDKNTGVDFPTSFMHDSIKRFFLPRRKIIMTFDNNEKWPLKSTAPPNKKRLIMGVHVCDSSALLYLDRVFADSSYKDPLYEAERKRTVIAGIHCDHMESMCHCTDRGISPDSHDGMDIVMSRTANGFLIKALTEKGNALLTSRTLVETDELPHTQKWSQGRYPLATPEAFLDFYSDDLWYATMQFCLTCGICTLGCPTCTCFSIADESYKDQGERLAIWDSCQFRSYSRMAAGHNPRARTIERIKNRILDKFAYSFLRYGRISCTGCGRCIASCPVNCSLPETAAFLTKSIRQKVSRTQQHDTSRGNKAKK